MSYWLFQGNPKYYRIIDAIRDLNSIPWSVTRYTKEMSIGDQVLIWKAGAKAGIYAIATITDTAKIIPDPPDLVYWLDQSQVGRKPQSILELTHKLIDQPLLKDNLKQDEILQHLSVIKQPHATNFKITVEQWERVKSLIG
jgi:predicted RNA-binding protein with PUA-like domain